SARSYPGLATKHGLDDNRRRPHVNHVDVQTVLFVIACFLGNPPGQAGGADGSKRKRYFGGRLRRKIGHSEKEKKGEKKRQWVSFHGVFLSPSFPHVFSGNPGCFRTGPPIHSTWLRVLVSRVEPR